MVRLGLISAIAAVQILLPAYSRGLQKEYAMYTKQIIGWVSLTLEIGMQQVRLSVCRPEL